MKTMLHIPIITQFHISRKLPFMSDPAHNQPICCPLISTRTPMAAVPSAQLSRSRGLWADCMAPMLLSGVCQHPDKPKVTELASSLESPCGLGRVHAWRSLAFALHVTLINT